MSFKVYSELITGDKGSGTYYYDVTETGFGTPVACMVVMDHKAPTDSVAYREDHFWGFGFTDGTNDKGAWAEYSDGSGSHYTETEKYDRIVEHIDKSGSTRKSLTFDQWITDGVKLKWIVQSGAIYFEMHLLVILFGGDGSSEVGDIDPDSDITGTGFAPDLMFASNSGKNAWSSNEDVWRTCMGMAEKANLTEASAVAYQQDGRGTSACETRFGNDAIINNHPDNPTVTVASWDAGGVSLTPNTSSTLGFAYLLLDINRTSPDTEILEITSPTSTGTTSHTFGFEAGEVFIIMGLASAINTDNTTAPASETRSFGVYDGTSETCLGTSSRDNQSTSNCYNWWSSNIVVCFDGAGTKELEATIDSISATQVTLDWTTVDSTARKGFMLAIKKEAAAGPTLPHMYHHYNRNLT